MGVALLAASGCGDASDAARGTHPAATLDAARRALRAGDAPVVPERFAVCHECHRAIVESFAAHGMASTLGPLDHDPSGEVTSPTSGARYAFEAHGDARLLREDASDGGLRRALVVGRYGAGVLDVSYVGSELGVDGRPTGRLAFLPVEALAGHGLVPTPFELDAATGFAMPFDLECLACHTRDDPSALPGAARDVLADPPPARARVWPGERLGVDALLRLEPLGCDACHGPTARHAQLMSDALARGERVPELGLPRLASLDAGTQRDVCARCHLQGEARLRLDELPSGPLDEPLAALRPTLVPAAPGDDFRFVGQTARLQLSACFGATPTMTCTSCHDPHTAVALQGTEAFDARCVGCHADDSASACVRPAGLAVRDVTGRAARTPRGCVDCHVRRSEPFDLPGVVTADHFVRRRIPAPGPARMRAYEDPDGALAICDDGRLAPALATPDGARFEHALAALVLPRMGRLDEALVAFDALPSPGTPAARGEEEAGPAAATEAESAGRALLRRLLRSPDLHHLRGVTLAAAGRTDEALAALDDALRLDASQPQARLERASLRLQRGDAAGARDDALQLVRRYPLAEKPWNVLAVAAAQAGDAAAAASALAESVARQPGDAATWHELGRLLLRLGQRDDARSALEQARGLQPSRPGLDADLAACAR
ncbi:MAG: hypothetical protein H6825_08435 [Planctomycetes bacterium]|nr:hypothetical protein [Planctomycetota bacterium]